MPVFRLASVSDFQPFMDIWPTRTVTAAIHMVTTRPATMARHIINRLSIIAGCTGLITGGTANAYLFGIGISGIKCLARVAHTVRSHVAAEFAFVSA